MERNTTEAGKLLVGLSYDYEYLSKAMVDDREWENINHERTNNTTYSLYLNYSLTENFSIEGIIPYRLVTNEKIMFTGQYSNDEEHPLYNGGQYLRETDGFGDVVIMTRIGGIESKIIPVNPDVVLNNDIVYFLFGLGIKLPSGDTDFNSIKCFTSSSCTSGLSKFPSIDFMF